MENLSSSAAQPLNLPSAEGRRRTEMCMILFLKVIAAINVLALAGVCAYLAIDHLGGFDAMMSILYSNPRFETNMKPLANWSLVQFLGLFFSFLLGEFCAPY